MIKRIIRIIILSALIVVGILGIIFTALSSDFMGGTSVFYFFTVQSNIFIIVMALLFLGHEIICLVRKEEKDNQIMLQIKFVATVAITVTFIVFFTMLAPLMGIDYLLSFNNFSLHAIVPILAIIDFIIFDTSINLSYPKSLIATIAPISYVIFVYAIGVPLKLQYAKDLYFPYFFLNYDQNGFLFEKGFGVIPWITILLTAIIGLGLLFCFFIKLRQKAVSKK
ncbi:MAG: Pr6Pr family membrane protein [Bacilli bacterium]|nr:Pr6Pr family membrane protein [Bacilli bacterium]